MYIPKHFEVKDQEELHRFIQSHAFGQLISNIDGRPFVSHLPFKLSEDKQQLLCHVARRNPQWQSIESQEILVTFQGAHDYISPTWYQSQGVPTWNYQAVHVYGKAELMTDSDELQTLVEELSAIYERQNPNPWQPDYKASMLNMIVGIKIAITEIQGKYKFSQNRSLEDRENVISKLQENGSNSLAKEMQK
ncbi:FMN-binding negative transcriptional regulator [Paraneptunicella aestuarii]|uniref:FMN-binding negative transcriptional regulator n=1 Tax=Paraneptunicella aestuarii TaxID=2831148 RepID=UPI001E4BA51E|nr:FMN-binding negative transcriptional regulator [Paraneptunicella aestuarii]UAA40234.1 FMN-binding negative transcriptional regulator [Paraneptunicella aestuarii]